MFDGQWYGVDKIQSLKQKEVINLRDGQRLGCVVDIEVDISCGCVAAITVSGPSKFFGLFGNGDISVKWCDIKKIGVDTIIVDIDIKKCKPD